MAPARIRSLEFLAPEKERAVPESAESGLRAGLEDGGESTFFVATPNQAARWLADTDFSFGAPVLYVRRLDQETVAQATQAMASDMSGYWLRYYNAASEVTPAPKKGRKTTTAACKVVSASISEAYPPRSPEGCAVIQARIEDGREFSVLTSTPAWFEKRMADLALPYYFGPSVLFVAELEPKLVRRAINAMAAKGDRWLCRYDTPRRTLPEVLADFKLKHFQQ